MIRFLLTFALFCATVFATSSCMGLAPRDEQRLLELSRVQQTRQLTPEELAELRALVDKAQSGGVDVDRIVDVLAGVVASLTGVYVWRGSPSRRKGLPPPSAGDA